MYRNVQESRFKHQQARKIPPNFLHLAPNSQDIYICQLSILAEPYK
jgi:hypothetical protein